MHSSLSSEKPGKASLPPKRLAVLALFAALSLALYGLESLIPVPVPVPGFRLGLSNIVTLAVLCRYGLRDSALVLLVRVLLAALLFGNPVSLLYSVCGGFLCLLAESLLLRLFDGGFLPLVSLCGGILHNLGQLLVARLILQSAAVFFYLPQLILLGALTGCFVGLAALYLLKKLPKL